jgi:hypothetical protein
VTITRLTPLANAAVRINTTNQVGVFIAHADGGTCWVRIADGNEVPAMVDDLTVITPGVRRPNRPARVVLTPAAKHALRGANHRDNGYFLDVIAYCDDKITAELLSLDLISNRGEDIAHVGRYPLTEGGLRMRGYLQHQFRLGQLAKQVRAEDITGEDLADLAAGIDAGEETGNITGTTVDFQLAFALAASLSDQSAEDLRQDLETYLGWND